MLTTYFISIFRNLLKNKIFSLINITGLALGMAAVLIIFLWVRDELSYEQYHTKKDQVALAYLMMTAGNDSVWEQVGYQPTTAPAIAKHLVSGYPEVLATARCGELGETVFRKDHESVIESFGIAAEPAVFDILTFHFSEGNPATALSQPNSIVLTKKLAGKYFRDQDPVGKTLVLNNRNLFTVTAVIEDMPDNAYRQYDFIVPFEYLEELGFDIRSTALFYPCSYYTYVLLEKGANFDSLNMKLSRNIFFNGKEARGKIGFVNLQNVYLTETGGTTRIYIFSVIAVMILLIACINYTNLAAASAVGRLKEIFTRKVNGAERKHLMVHFLTESFVISLIALGLGLTIVYWFLPHFNQLTSKTISFSLLNLRTLAACFLLLFITSVVAGIYPAVILSSMKMRGPADLFQKTIGGKRNFQKVLLFFQLTLTVIFIISSIVIFRQSCYIRKFSSGLSKQNILYSSLGGTIKGKIPMLKQALLTHPDILSVSSGANLPNVIRTGSYYKWGFPDRPGTRIVSTEAGYDYLKTFDIQMARGRFYQPEYSTDSSDAIVVNEAAMHKLGRDIPVDSQFYYLDRNYKLIGVVKDFQHNTPINIGVEPLCIRLSNNNNDFLFIKQDPKIRNTIRQEALLQFINETAKRLSPDYPLEFRFLDSYTYPEERALESWQKLVLYSSILCIGITCMGLLALVYLSTSQRTREIGVHKVNGARLIDVMMRFYKGYFFWTFLANILAWPVAWYLMDQFLERFAYKAPVIWWIFPISGLLSIMIILATTTWHIYFVASRNPAEALNYE